MGPHPRSCAFSGRNSAGGPETSFVLRVLLSSGWGPAGQEGVGPKDALWLQRFAKATGVGDKSPLSGAQEEACPPRGRMLRGRGPCECPADPAAGPPGALSSQKRREELHTFRRVQMLSCPTSFTNGAAEDIAVTRMSARSALSVNVGTCSQAAHAALLCMPVPCKQKVRKKTHEGLNRALCGDIFVPIPLSP